MRALRPLLFGLVLFTTACGASRSAGSSTTRDRRVAERVEIEEALGQNVTTVYDFVAARHPDWMRGRGSVSGVVYQPAVYLDGARQGALTAMRSISLGIVTRIRYLAASEAQIEFGLDTMAGVISIHTR